MYLRFQENYRNLDVPIRDYADFECYNHLKYLEVFFKRFLYAVGYCIWIKLESMRLKVWN